MTTTVCIATWQDGLFMIANGASRRELAGRAVRALAPDGRNGLLAIVDGRSLYRRAPEGVWNLLAHAETELACCVALADVVYLGTDEATLLRVDAAGHVERLHGFEAVAGRDTWYAGTTRVDGQLVGPPLGVRTLTTTADGAALLANVHVGGIPRSTDAGASWRPTIDIDCDVHEVRAHPDRAGIVAAATAAGLAMSRDGGSTWRIEARGLHEVHCSAVAFSGDDVLVSAATDPFAVRGAVYRWCAKEPRALVPVRGGLPEWLERGVDTGCIATNGAVIAIIDRGGNLYLSTDDGNTWSHAADGIPGPLCLQVL